MRKATVKEVKDFFGMSMPEMKAEWIHGGLTEEDKDEIQRDIGMLQLRQEISP